MAAPSLSASVLFSDLVNAFELVSSGAEGEEQAYLDCKTGQLYFVSEAAGIAEGPEDIEESDQYLAIPHKNDMDLGRNLVFAFAGTELPDEYDRVVDMFRRKGAYARFKDLLDDHDKRNAWHAFEERAAEKALRDWCEENGVQVREA